MMNHPQTILVTGAAGFIARYVVRYFSEKEWIVVGIDQSPPDNAPQGNLAAYYQINLPDDRLNSILDRHHPDVCVNCAGRASIGLSFSDPMADYLGNTVLVSEMLNAIRTTTPHCIFINISSAAVYGNPHTLPVREDLSPAPISPYGFHKLQSEIICKEYHHVYGVPTASVRIFSAYGPGLRRQVLWDICQKALTGKDIVLQGTGKESRDFIHAHDIARAVFVLLNNAPMKGESYNLAAGQETTIAELVSILTEALGYDGNISYEGHVPRGTPLNWHADITRIKELGFDVSIPLHVGTQNYAVWCRSELGFL